VLDRYFRDFWRTFRPERTVGSLKSGGLLAQLWPADRPPFVPQPRPARHSGVPPRAARLSTLGIWMNKGRNFALSPVHHQLRAFGSRPLTAVNGPGRAVGR